MFPAENRRPIVRITLRRSFKMKSIGIVAISASATPAGGIPMPPAMVPATKPQAAKKRRTSGRIPCMVSYFYVVIYGKNPGSLEKVSMGTHYFSYRQRSGAFKLWPRLHNGERFCSHAHHYRKEFCVVRYRVRSERAPTPTLVSLHFAPFVLFVSETSGRKLSPFYINSSSQNYTKVG